jgi:GT2 family glycosyltransferase
VDNASSDGSGYQLRAELSPEKVNVILNPENDGFAAANNIGIAQAQTMGVDYIWLLNADTEVEENALSALVAVASQNENAVALGSKILYAREHSSADNQLESKDVIWSAGAKICFNSKQVEMLGWKEVDDGRFDQQLECDYLPGCSLFVRANYMQAVGVMPEDFFMYFEETEWCTRMRAHGYKLLYVPTSRIIHHFQDSKNQQAFGVYYYNRNSRRFWFMHDSIKGRIFSWLKVCIKELPVALKAYFYAPSHELKDVFKAHVMAYVDFLTFRNGKSATYSSR